MQGRFLMALIPDITITVIIMATNTIIYTTSSVYMLCPQCDHGVFTRVLQGCFVGTEAIASKIALKNLSKISF